MSDMTSPLPAGAASPANPALPISPIEKVWRTGSFMTAMAYLWTTILGLLGLGLLMAVLGMFSEGSVGSAFQLGIAALAVLSAAYRLLTVSNAYRKNSATFDANSVTFRKGADDPKPVRIPFEQIDRVSTWSGSTMAIQDAEGLIYSFNAYEFFKPSKLAREISDRSGKRFQQGL